MTSGPMVGRVRTDAFGRSGPRDARRPEARRIHGEHETGMNRCEAQPVLEVQGQAQQEARVGPHDQQDRECRGRPRRGHAGARGRTAGRGRPCELVAPTPRRTSRTPPRQRGTGTLHQGQSACRPRVNGKTSISIVAARSPTPPPSTVRRPVAGIGGSPGAPPQQRGTDRRVEQQRGSPGTVEQMSRDEQASGDLPGRHAHRQDQRVRADRTRSRPPWYSRWMIVSTCGVISAPAAP